MQIDLIEEELQIYNSKMRLLNWLFDELKIQSEEMKEYLNEKGQMLPINI